jgi:hypothetical protein
VTQAELLGHVVDALESVGVPYMIGGSQASIYYGEPRMTQDIDIVVELDIVRLCALLERFPAEEFYVSESAATEAVETSGQFNIIHPESGLKVDIFVNKRTDYDQARLARRQRRPFLPGREAFFARPEDIILYKLLYFLEGESDLHVRDIVGILRVSGPELDLAYIAEWADRLGVRDIWRSVLAKAETTRP